MKFFIILLTILFSAVSIADTAETYTCSIAGQFLQQEFNDESRYNLEVDGEPADLSSKYFNEFIGTLRLRTFGSEDLMLIFRPRGSGTYLSGRAPVGSDRIGFSHALFLNGSLRNESFFANCERL